MGLKFGRELGASKYSGSFGAEYNGKKIGNHGIKMWGNPNLELHKHYKIKNYLKEHRVFMVSVIAALSFGGNWNIYDPDSIKTSFPNFLKITKKLGGKIN